MKPNQPTTLKYHPEIDGLRAVAVIPVVLFHADLGFNGGYVGVDVFFVISGFLITSLILKDLDAGSFSILDFWSRRVRRIIPAVTVVMAACLVAGWFIFWPADYQDLGNSAAAQSLFVSNIFFWMQSGYFDDPSAIKPLLHTWSLSVEEQFYLGFPWVLMLLASFKSSLRIWVLGISASLSFLLAVYGSYRHPSATFYLIPTRAWELLAGALLAMAGSKTLLVSRRLAETLSWAGLTLVACAVFFYDGVTRFPGLTALTPVVGTVLIIWTNTARLTILGRVLSNPILVFIGLISYSLYLWHWPLLVFSQYWSLQPLDVSARVLLVAVSFMLAAACWKWVEIPFRRKRPEKRRSKVLALGVVSLLTISVSGYLIALAEGVSHRVPPEAAVYAEGTEDRAFIEEVTLEDALAGSFVPMGSTDMNDPIQALVWGDSHAMAVMPVIDYLCSNHGVRCLGATHSSTAPLLRFESNTKHGLNRDSTTFNNAVIEYIQRWKIKNVVLVALWRGYGIEGDSGRFRAALSYTINEIGRAGAKAWIVLEAPSHDVDIPRALARARLAGQDISSLGVTVQEQKDKVALQREIFSKASGNVEVLDPLEYFMLNNGFCEVASEGRSLYSDNHHLSVHGSMRILRMFEPIFVSSN